MKLNLQLPERGPNPIPKDFPLETKQILSCLLTYLDGTEAIIVVKPDQGYHRTSKIGHVLQHEVYVITNPED